MVLKWLKQTLVRPARAPLPVGPASAQSVPVAERAPIYPPRDGGLVLLSPEQILEGNHAVLERLRLHAASGADAYSIRYEDPLRRLAAQISVLPATATGLFAGAGGLYRAALEMAFFCFQSADGRIFTGDLTVERRHALENRWRYVCFVAGMLYPLGKALERMVVTAADGRHWSRHHSGLHAWAESTGVDRVFVSWAGDQTGKEELGPSAYTTAMVAAVIGPENLQWLEEGSPELVKAVYDIVSGAPASSRNASDVVSTTWLRICEREAARNPQNYGRLSVGTHLGPYLVGAMRTLVQTKKWIPNGGALAADADGVYLVWPRAATELIDFGVEAGHLGWPRNEATIAELLKASLIVSIDPSDDLGMISVVDKEGEILRAFRLLNPMAVLEGYDPDDYRDAPPKTMEGVSKADPLSRPPKQHHMPPDPPAGAERAEPSSEQSTGGNDAAQGAETVTRDGRASPRKKSGEQQGALDLAADDGAEVAVGRADGRRIEAQEISARQTEAAHADERAAEGAPASGRLQEPPAIKFSDLVPDDVKRDLKKSVNADCLGKAVMAWRERGERSTHMRRTEHGAAFSYEFLKTIARDAPAWVADLGDAGLVHTMPSAPGRKVLPVAIPEGTKPRDAVTLTNYACKKLGL